MKRIISSEQIPLASPGILQAEQRSTFPEDGSTTRAAISCAGTWTDNPPLGNPHTAGHMFLRPSGKKVAFSPILVKIAG